MFYLSSTGHNCVDFLDGDALLTDFAANALKGFEDYLISCLIIDRPRGLLKTQDNEIAIAAYNSVSLASYYAPMSQVFEYDGRVMGLNNHDVMLKDGQLQIISSAPVKSSDFDLALVSRQRPQIPSEQPIEGHQYYLINTVSTDQAAFTHLGVRTSKEGDRDTTHDGVKINGTAIAHPSGIWNSPHHPAKDGSGNWWVCNSGGSELVNTATNTAIAVGGFPRGLTWIDQSGLTGFLFTKSVLRGDTSQQSGQLSFLDPSNGTTRNLLLPQRRSPYTFVID